MYQKSKKYTNDRKWNRDYEIEMDLLNEIVNTQLKGNECTEEEMIKKSKYRDDDLVLGLEFRSRVRKIHNWFQMEKDVRAKKKILLRMIPENCNLIENK